MRKSGSRSDSSPENFHDTKSKAGFRRPYLCEARPRLPGNEECPQLLPVHVHRVFAVGRSRAATEANDAHVAYERAAARVRDGHGVDRTGAELTTADQRAVAVVHVQ